MSLICKCIQITYKTIKTKQIFLRWYWERSFESFWRQQKKRKTGTVLIHRMWAEEEEEMKAKLDKESIRVKGQKRKKKKGRKRHPIKWAPSPSLKMRACAWSSSSSKLPVGMDGCCSICVLPPASVWSDVYDECLCVAGEAFIVCPRSTFKPRADRGLMRFQVLRFRLS